MIQAQANAALGGGAGFGDPRIQELLADLTELGVGTTGFRSRQQMLATLQGLLDKHPDQDPMDIAQAVKAGKLSFTAQTKEVATAAGVAGRVAVSAKEIERMAPLALNAIGRVPRTSWLPINKLLTMQETATMDPNLRQLRIALNSLLNAYDMLASRGGTDVAKRAEAHALINAADSPEALKAGLQMFMAEAQVAEEAAAEAMNIGSDEGKTPKGNDPAGIRTVR
ncbi:MAG TPA: hypothetical protein VF740_07630, partial [Candidatus Acidoferrum sp.]